MKRFNLFKFLLFFTLASLTSLVASGQESWEKYRDEACKSFVERSNKVNEEFKLASYERWDVNQATGKLIFSDKGVAKVIATVEFVGSWSSISNTWLWAWNNPSIVPAMKKKVEKVKDVGKQKMFSELSTSKLSSDEEYAWTLTAVAGHLLGAKTAYRAPYEGGSGFLLVFDIKWAK